MKVCQNSNVIVGSDQGISAWNDVFAIPMDSDQEAIVRKIKISYTFI